MNNNSSSFLAQCEMDSTPVSYAWLIAYKLITAFLFCCTVVGTPANIVVLSCIPKVKLWPASIRYLLISISICMCLVELNYFIRFFQIDLPLALKLKLAPMEPGHCGIQSILQVFPSAVGINCMLMIARDRWKTTRDIGKKVTSEPTTRWLLLKCFGIWMSGGCCFGIYLAQSYLAFYPDTMLCFCVSLFAFYPLFLIPMAAVYISLEILMSVAYFYILYKNRIKFSDFSINTATHSLNERFCLSETIQLTEMLFPSVLLHTICWVTVLVLSLPTVLGSEEVYVRLTLGLITEAFIYIHSALHPFVLLWKNRHLRRQVLLRFGKASAKISAVKGLDGVHGTSVGVSTDPSNPRKFGVDPRKNQEILDRIWAQKSTSHLNLGKKKK